jgi:hypothetical protein
LTPCGLHRRSVFAVIARDFTDNDAMGFYLCVIDEGMTNRPSIFAYLVFGLGEITVEGIARPIRAAARRGRGAILGVQERIRGVQIGLVFG